MATGEVVVMYFLLNIP